MRVLIDTNVVMDVLFERKPFFESAYAIWQAVEEGRLEGYISAITGFLRDGTDEEYRRGARSDP